MLMDPNTQVKFIMTNVKEKGKLKSFSILNDSILNRIYNYANGDKYVGDWKVDKFHGFGIYIFCNGERYEGQLLKGQKNG